MLEIMMAGMVAVDAFVGLFVLFNNCIDGHDDEANEDDSLFSLMKESELRIVHKKDSLVSPLASSRRGVTQPASRFCPSIQKHYKARLRLPKITPNEQGGYCPLCFQSTEFSPGRPVSECRFCGVMLHDRCYQAHAKANGLSKCPFCLQSD